MFSLASGILGSDRLDPPPFDPGTVCIAFDCEPFNQTNLRKAHFNFPLFPGPGENPHHAGPGIRDVSFLPFMPRVPHPMKIFCHASEQVKLPVQQQRIPLSLYLQHPERLVSAIARADQCHGLQADFYQLKTKPLNFWHLYSFQPEVILKIWSAPSGRVYLQGQQCRLLGLEELNDRFTLHLKGHLSPHQEQDHLYLQGQAQVRIEVTLPPALWLTPKPLLENAGNLLVREVLTRIKQRILKHLLQDYYQWQHSDLAQKQFRLLTQEQEEIA